MECNGVGEFNCISCDLERVFSNYNYDESGYCLAFEEKMALFASSKNISFAIENITSVIDLF